MKSLGKLLFLLLVLALPLKAQVYRCDAIAYQLVLWDSTFQNGTCGYPGYFANGFNCHLEKGSLTRGDTIYMHLEYVDGYIAVNRDYGKAVRSGDSLLVWHYESPLPWTYKYMGDVPPNRDYLGPALFNPAKRYAFYSGSLVEASIIRMILYEGFVPTYVGTKSATTGKITIRGFKVIP
jgi:hypothetical protein